MLNDETRAAERLRKYMDGEPMYMSNPEGPRDDLAKLANAYLREHPADDAEPVTEEWMNSLACEDSVSGLWYYFAVDASTSLIIAMASNRNWASVEDDASTDGVFLRDISTRGDVRRLCWALGIELKEQSK